MTPFFWDNIDKLWVLKIYQDWFEPYSNVIAISDGDNSYKDNVFCLGINPSNGCGAHISYLLHEMGHFVEIDDSRCHLPGWGLKTGKWNEFFNCEEGMTTNLAIEREIRVFGIEIMLAMHYNLDSIQFDPEYCAKVCRFIDGIYSYYPENWQEMNYDECKQAGYVNITNRIKAEILKWDIKKFTKEWIRKIGILKTKNHFNEG